MALRWGGGAVEGPNRGPGGKPLRLLRLRLGAGTRRRLTVVQAAEQFLLRRRDGHRLQVLAVEGREQIPQDASGREPVGDDVVDS